MPPPRHRNGNQVAPIRYVEMITRVSLDLISYQNDRKCSTTIAGKAKKRE